MENILFDDWVLFHDALFLEIWNMRNFLVENYNWIILVACFYFHKFILLTEEVNDFLYFKGGLKSRNCRPTKVRGVIWTGECLILMVLDLNMEKTQTGFLKKVLLRSPIRIQPQHQPLGLRRSAKRVILISWSYEIFHKSMKM